jgi:hypothetical protein
MVNKNAKIKLEYVKDKTNILKLKVSLRHIFCTTYRCFLRYKPNSVGVSGLTHYAHVSVLMADELLVAVHTLPRLCITCLMQGTYLKFLI